MKKAKAVSKQASILSFFQKPKPILSTTKEVEKDKKENVATPVATHVENVVEKSSNPSQDEVQPLEDEHPMRSFEVFAFAEGPKSLEAPACPEESEVVAVVKEEDDEDNDTNGNDKDGDEDDDYDDDDKEAQHQSSSSQQHHQSELSEYEKIRLENIRKNEEFLASMGFDNR